MRISDWSSDVCSSDLRLTSLTAASALETGHSTLAWLASSVIFSAGRSTSTTVDRAMRLMVGPSSPTMIETLAVVWIEVGGVSFLVRSRARYCEKQPACAEIGRAHVCTHVTNAQ